MGCDIHLFTEKKRHINNEEKWVNVDNWKINPYFTKGNTDGEGQYTLNSAYRQRNYALFAILADVRNYAGNLPISTPKGLPEDVSSIVKYESEQYGSDGHSHSYFTMKELYNYYEKNNVVRFSGLVDKKGVKQIEAGEMPDWFCQGSTHKDLVYKEWELENFPLKKFIEILENHFESEYYRKEEEADKFRIVFWFDN